MKIENNCLLEGIISVKACIEGKSRCIEQVYVDLDKRKKRDRKILGFLSYLKEKEIPVILAPRSEIDALVKEHTRENAGSSHGGVVAFAGKRSYLTTEELLSNAKAGDYFVYLDGIEDPYNLGYCIRTLYAMGASGFILSDRDWESCSGVISRSSAGASELCKIALADKDDEYTAQTIKKYGVDIVCSALSAESVPLYSFNPEKPFVLFIGGEKRGISKPFMENAARVVHIPYARENVRYSLTAASVCAMYASHLYGYANKENASVDICSDM